MIKVFSLSLSRFLLAAFIACAPFAVHAAMGTSDATTSDSEDKSREATELNIITNAIKDAGEKISNQSEAINIRMNDAMRANNVKMIESTNKREKIKKRLNLMPSPDIDLAISLGNERVSSVVLADQARVALDEINYKVTTGYVDVPSVGYFSTANPNARGSIAAIGTIYDLQTALFCNPDGMENAPAGCGRDRVRAGITGNETFVDFMLSERTWPKATVLDTMQVARYYFFGADSGSLGVKDLKRNRAPFIREQGRVATDNLRMSMLSFIAARRAPTSTATGDVLKVLLNNMAVTGGVSDTNYERVCNSTAAPVAGDSVSKQLEAYVCNMTNIPEKAGEARIISQAAIDRIMQHDYYFSPIFYATVNNPSPVEGSMEKMEVMIMAQQLTQDYYFLRMLQMKTAASALSLVDR